MSHQPFYNNRIQQINRWNIQQDPESTHPDRCQNELELRFMLKHVEGKTLNLGCGPGYETHLCSEKTGYAVGTDIQSVMLNLAQTNYGSQNTHFMMADAKVQGDWEKIIDTHGLFDTITTRRMLINLGGWSWVKTCLDLAEKALKPDGRIIIIEGSAEGYRGLNNMRENLGLNPIKIVEHNHPIPVNKLDRFYSRHHLIAEENLSSYYALTRLFYPLIDTPEYNSPYAQQAKKFQICLGDIDIPSPIIMRCYGKRVE